MRIGIDAGNYEVKTVGPNGPDRFFSLIGEYRERSVVQKHSDDDMEWEYEGHSLKRGFAGPLALYESELACSTFGDTKYHEDARLRVLLALWRYGNSGAVQMVCGQPLATHSRDKAFIKEFLQGTHSLTVNGTRKTFAITCEVAIEGGAAFWAEPAGGLVRVIDMGSGTVNLCTLRDKKYQDRASRTLGFGMETLRGQEPPAIARRVCQEARTLGWEPHDTVRIVGGSAEDMTLHVQGYFPEARAFFPTVSVGGIGQKYSPTFANAAGMYVIGGAVFK